MFLFVYWASILKAIRNLHENPLEKARFGHFWGQMRIGTLRQKSRTQFA